VLSANFGGWHSCVNSANTLSFCVVALLSRASRLFSGIAENRPYLPSRHANGHEGTKVKLANEINSTLLTTGQAAELLLVSTRTIKRKVNAGDLVAKRDGRRLLIHRWSVDAYLNSLPNARGARR
jgi:excisionase family DNA binding protein